MPAHACLVLLNCFEVIVQRTSLIWLLFGSRGRISRSRFWAGYDLHRPTQA
jgi:hypothetical protein